MEASKKSPLPQSVEILQVTRPAIATSETKRLKVSTLDSAQDQMSSELVHQKSLLKTSTLLNVAPQSGDVDIERVSTGTKYALALWLAFIK